MKLITFEYEGKQQIGVLSEDGRTIVRVCDVLGLPADLTMTEFIQRHGEDDLAALKKASECAGTIETRAVRTLSPIPRPIHDVLCVGVNYASHVEETRHGLKDQKFQRPEKSIYFGKRAVEIQGPDAEIQGRFDLDEEMDYEAELAVIIGRRCRDVAPEDTEECIFGYSVFNDLSSRKLQRLHKQWLRGKSLDGYTAMGPVILTRDELPYPIEADVISRVNGEERQHSNTRLFLNDVPGIVSDLSMGMTLEPGDIIATGTPAGVAMGMDEPKWLKPGDVVECEIPPIGVLRNRIR